MTDYTQDLMNIAKICDKLLDRIEMLETQLKVIDTSLSDKILYLEICIVKLQEHKYRQVDENRAVSRKIDELEESLIKSKVDIDLLFRCVPETTRD